MHIGNIKDLIKRKSKKSDFNEVVTYPSKKQNKFLKFFTKKRIIIISIILVIIIGIIVLVSKKKSSTEVSKTYTETEAKVGNVTETIKESGVIEPYERYEITALVKGEIIASPYNEGDKVEEDAILYQIDSEDAQLSLEKQQNSIEKSQMSLDEARDNISKLNIYAPVAGKVTNFKVTKGDKINAGTLGSVIGTSTLTVDVPFTATDFSKISIGDSATVVSSLYMTSLSGTVTHKYNTTGGNALKNVEIEISNPGSLETGTTVSARIDTSSGTVSSAGSGSIDEGSETAIQAEVGGTVTSVSVKNGDYVKKGQLIAVLSNNDLYSSQKTNQLNLKDSQLSLKSSQKSLDDYKITSPISGTIITKTSKVGDKIDNSTQQTTMMVVADMSKVKFTIDVDELDISKVKLGQSAIVDADAIEGETFAGTVTNIASEGTSSGDGVTTYTVEITIDKPGALLSGMNVNANIVVNEAKNVVTIPEEALMNTNNGSATVLIKDANAKTSKTDKTVDKQSMPKQSENKTSTNKEQTNNSDKSADGNKKGGMSAIPDGYKMVKVEYGVSDGENVEIKSGISDGDTVAYIPVSTSSSTNPFMMMGGPGGAHGAGQQGGNQGNRSSQQGQKASGQKSSGGNSK